MESFRKLVKKAQAAGLAVCADANVPAIRLIIKEECDKANDIRDLGETVRVDNGCGGGGSTSSGLACNYGNL